MRELKIEIKVKNEKLKIESDVSLKTHNLK